MAFLFSLLVIALMVGALIDIITRVDSQVRFLPKMAWIIIVILLPLIGSLLWFAIGREYESSCQRMMNFILVIYQKLLTRFLKS